MEEEYQKRAHVTVSRKIRQERKAGSGRAITGNSWPAGLEWLDGRAASIATDEPSMVFPYSETGSLSVRGMVR